MIKTTGSQVRRKFTIVDSLNAAETYIRSALNQRTRICIYRVRFVAMLMQVAYL